MGGFSDSTEHSAIPGRGCWYSAEADLALCLVFADSVGDLGCLTAE